MKQELVKRIYDYFDKIGGYNRTKEEQKIWLELKKALGVITDIAQDYLDYELKDDETLYGGVSFSGETLKDFLDEIDMSHDTPIRKVNKALMDCGIEPIKPCGVKEMYYQPTIHNEYTFPDRLCSFQVFHSKKGCEDWFIDNGYNVEECVISIYFDNDIEEHVYID